MTAAETPQPGGRRRWLPWAALALLCLALMWAVAWLRGAWRRYTSEAFAASQLNDLAAQYVDGQVVFDSAHVIPPRGVIVRNLQITPAATPKLPLLEIGRARLDLNPWSLVFGPIEPTRLTLNDCSLRLRRLADGRWNAATALKPQPEGGGPAPNLRLFPEGVFLRFAYVGVRDALLFGDERERAFERAHITLTPATDGFDSFNLHATLLGGPLRGGKISGWLDSSQPNSPPSFNIEADLPWFEITPELLALLPARYLDLARQLNPKGAATGRVILTLRQPDSQFDWSAQAEVAGVQMISSVWPVDARSLSATVSASSRRLQVPYVSARAYDGALEGAGVIQFPDDPAKAPFFDFWIALEKASLQDMTRTLGDSARGLSGQTRVFLSATGDFGGPDSIIAKGEVSITQGTLADLPVLAGFFNIISLQLPGRTVFDTAEVRFTVLGGVVTFEHILLSSQAVEVTGRGTIRLDGETDLILAAVSPKTSGGIPLISDAFNVVIRGVQGAILPPVRVTGKIWAPKWKVMKLEPIRRPLRSVLDLAGLLGSSTE